MKGGGVGMKNGWQTTKLGEVATLQRGFDLPTQDRVSGQHPLVSSSGIIDTHHLSAVSGPGVVTGRSGSIGNVFFVEEDFWPLNTVLYVKDFHGNDPRFVYHLLNKFDLKRFATGAGVPTLNRNFVHEEPVSVPPIGEQRRIVAILDEAFEAIDKAKQYAEKNLRSARELFESHLQSVFTRSGDGWVEKRLDEVCVLQRGFDLPTHSRKTGKYPLVSSNGITDRIDLWKVRGPGVVTGRSGTIGKLHFVEDDFWPLNTALYIKDFHGNYERCVYYFLKWFDLGAYSSGAGVPTLNRNNVHSERVFFRLLWTNKNGSSMDLMDLVDRLGGSNRFTGARLRRLMS